MKLYPMDALEESVEFISVLSEMFRDSASTVIKNAYAETLTDLLEPISLVSKVLLLSHLIII